PGYEHAAQQRAARPCLVCDCRGAAFDQHGLVHIHHSSVAAGVTAGGIWAAGQHLSGNDVHTFDLAVASALAVSEGLDSGIAVYLCGISQLARLAAANRGCGGSSYSADCVRGCETTHGELRKRTGAAFCASCGTARGDLLFVSSGFPRWDFLSIHRE